MRVRLLTLQYSAALGGFDDRPLVEWVADKRLLDVREHFFLVDHKPHLACLVTYEGDSFRATQGLDGPAQKKSGSAVSVAGLAESERPLFESLREWRSSTARREGVPPYIILTNRQLVTLIRARPQSKSALQQLEGIGPERVKRHGDAILRLLGGGASMEPKKKGPTTDDSAPPWDDSEAADSAQQARES